VEHESLSPLDEELHEAVTLQEPQVALRTLEEFFAKHVAEAGESEGFNISSNHPRHGGTALHMAACLGRTELVLKLVERNADVNARATNLSTPLHWAAGMGQLATVRALLKQGADTSARTSTWYSSVFGKASGQTAAHWAAESGHVEVLKVLHAHDPAVVGMEDERETTPLALAEKEMKGECSEFLKDAVGEQYFAVKFSVLTHETRFLSGQPPEPNSGSHELLLA